MESKLVDETVSLNEEFNKRLPWNSALSKDVVERRKFQKQFIPRDFFSFF